LKRSKHELVRLVELVMREVGLFAERGVWLCVDELEASGQPLERIRAWATLHFLPAGSPFDSDDPDVWVWPLREEAAEFLRVQMGLIQSVRLEWAAVRGVIHPGVAFVGNGGHRM
jgi:hypothetical protein